MNKNIPKISPLRISNCDPNILKEVQQEYAELSLVLKNQVNSIIKSLSYTLNKQEKYEQLVESINSSYGEEELQNIKKKIPFILTDCDPDLATKSAFLRTMRTVFEVIFGARKGKILSELLDRTPTFYNALYTVIELHFNIPGQQDTNGNLLIHFLSSSLNDQALFLLSQNISIGLIENITGLSGEHINLLDREF